MKLQDKEFKAIIFDMDGTLIDSTGIWKDIDYQFFKKRGMDKVPEDYAQKIVHMGLYNGAKMTIETYDFTDDTVEGIIKEWEDASREAYEKTIPLKPYARECLSYFKSHGVKLALATANDESLYRPCLNRLDIGYYFDVISDVIQAGEGKSSPKIYDTIADALNIKKEEIIVIEDTIVGLKTAYENGYIAVGIDDPASRNIEKEKKSHCFLYVYSLKELIEKTKE